MAPPAPAGSDQIPPCPPCPVCHGKMEVVYDRTQQQVCVCVDCHTGLTIPAAAWEIQRNKRGRKT